MNRQMALELFTYARTSLLETLDGLSLEQINKIPRGFNNNLAWQLGHVVAVDQRYIYEKGGKPINVEDIMLAMYGNGTKPERDISAEELETLKKNALHTVEKLKQDVAANHFDTYTPHNMRHLTFNGLDDVMALILYHEGLHVGAAKDLRRAVTMFNQPGENAA